jgi:hypothetical protein
MLWCIFILVKKSEQGCCKPVEITISQYHSLSLRFCFYLDNSPSFSKQCNPEAREGVGRTGKVCLAPSAGQGWHHQHSPEAPEAWAKKDWATYAPEYSEAKGLLEGYE